MRLITPSRCEASLPDVLDQPYLVGEPKMDGSRYVFYIGFNPYTNTVANTLLSRHVSVRDHKHVDKTANVPHITGVHMPELHGTILDGEIMSDDFLATNSIMNSGPALAVQKQKDSKLMYYVFDILYFRGKDVSTMPLEQRRKILVEVVKRIDNECVVAIEQVQGDLTSYFREIVDAGGEGIIVKNLRMPYGRGWAKMKKSYDVSCVVSGWKPGQGKYSDTIGSIALSVWHDGRLLEVGFASGFDDKLRHAMSKDFESFLHKPVDVFAQEIQASKRSEDNPVGRLRHPTFHRFRDDIEGTDCTAEKLIADLKATKPKSNRYKGRV